jgi:hypothetical protein
MAYGHELCGELSVYRHHLDKPPLPHAVCGQSDAEIGLDQLRPSLHGVAPALCDGMDGANPALLDPRVALYAAIFVCVAIAYNVFEREVFAKADATQISERAQRMARRQSLTVLAIFASTMLIAFIAPWFGFGLVCSALILHLRPEALGIFSGKWMPKWLSKGLKRMPG